MTNPSQIPYRIRLGVTGHRTLSDIPALTQCLQRIIDSGYLDAFTPVSQEKIKQAKATSIVFSIISPLAEGADRLAANIVLEHGGSLEVLLPRPREEYETDFITTESRKEFADLFDRAHRKTVIKGNISPEDSSYRQKSYLYVGEEVVNRCDILIALWDGKPSRGVGGTADILSFALKQKKPVFIISTVNPGTVNLENGGCLQAKFISELDKYNSFPIDSTELNTSCEDSYKEIFPSPLAAPLPVQLKKIVNDHLIPPYCRASKIAETNQSRYKQTGWLGYLFSTLSVAFMAFAVVFAKQPLLSIPGYIAELCLLISLYIMIHRAERTKVQSGWLEHRALAERLRMAFYFIACGESPMVSNKGRSIYRHNFSWVDHAYYEILSGIPSSLIARPPAAQIKPYRKFIDTSWIQGQIDYHTVNSEKLTKKNHSFKKWGLRCFKLAIFVSLIHLGFALYAINNHLANGMVVFLEELLSIIAITLPAAGAAVNGYRSLLEQSRIATRSKAMAYHLSNIQEQSHAELRPHLENIQEAMLIESEDWFALMQHAELGKIA